MRLDASTGDGDRVVATGQSDKVFTLCKPRALAKEVLLETTPR